MKSPSGNFIANEIFSNEIQNLLRKKIFAKSKYFYSTKNPPKDPTKIIPIGASSKASVIKNYIVCTLILIVYFINIFKMKSKDSGKNLILIYSLSKEQSIRDGSIKSLHTFLESKGLATNPDSVILIEIRKILWSKKYKKARTTLDIPLRIYIDNFSPILKVFCWLSMCKRFFIIMLKHRKNSQLTMVFKEFIFDQIVYSAMDPTKTDKLITTQSNIAYQPLIFEYENFNSKRIMIWYSSNSIPVQYKKVNLERFEINPAVYKNMRIDVHWVWTKEHKNYLSKLTKSEIFVKQSLMFYTAERSISAHKKYDVLIFDVTPFNNPSISKNSIYTTKEMINFISEIIVCVNMLNYKHKKNYSIHLKHKRTATKNHSSSYLKFIDQKLKNFEINVIDSHQNLYGLINDSELVVGFPFTSPVVIGQELNKPSIFYCSSELLPIAHKNSKPSFIQNQTLLYSYIEKALVKTK
jgi:polysaccharide biosynthesis PFTS motif protein